MGTSRKGDFDLEALFEALQAMTPQDSTEEATMVDIDRLEAAFLPPQARRNGRRRGAAAAPSDDPEAFGRWLIAFGDRMMPTRTR